MWGTPDVLPRSPMHRWGVLSRRPATPGRWRHPDRLADTARHGKTILTPRTGAVATVSLRPMPAAAVPAWTEFAAVRIIVHPKH
jgi:hypothetical protein